jgi:RNA polymerase sigma-70 factor (ECF subfamily)
MNFENIYKEYWQKVYRLSLGYLNDPDAAKDMTQETFIKVWKNLDNFRKEAVIGTWIFRIATNTCLRQIEVNKRVSNTTLSDSNSFETIVPDQIEEKTQLLYQYISELPEIERIIISLELEDVKQSDIAIIVGISDSNVRVKIHRIKEKLTQKFRNNEF